MMNSSLCYGGYNCTNTTFCACDKMEGSYGLDEWVQPVLLCLYFGSFFLALAGNFSILMAILRRQPGNVTNIFIGSLCLSDILVTVICVPTTVTSNLIYYYWPFWSFLCPLVMFLQVLTVLQRSLTLLAMTLDKHYAVWKPLSPRLKRRFVKVLMLVIWIVSAVIALPVYLAGRIKYLEHEPGSLGLCMEVWDDEKAATRYSYFLFIVQYMIPLIVMAISYTHIAYIIWVKKPPGECLKDRDKRIASSKRKAVKMLMSVVLVYAICWLPLHVLTIIGQEDPTIFNDRIVHSVWLFAHWLAISNSGVNPVVYLWMNTSYRRGIMDLFMCCTRNRWTESLRRSHYTSVKSTGMSLLATHDGMCCQMTKMGKHQTVAPKISSAM